MEFRILEQFLMLKLLNIRILKSIIVHHSCEVSHTCNKREFNSANHYWSLPNLILRNWIIQIFVRWFPKPSNGVFYSQNPETKLQCQSGKWLHVLYQANLVQNVVRMKRNFFKNKNKSNKWNHTVENCTTVCFYRSYCGWQNCCVKLRTRLTQEICKIECCIQQLLMLVVKFVPEFHSISIWILSNVNSIIRYVVEMKMIWIRIVEINWFVIGHWVTDSKRTTGSTWLK